VKNADETNRKVDLKGWIFWTDNPKPTSVNAVFCR